MKRLAILTILALGFINFSCSSSDDHTQTTGGSDSNTLTPLNQFTPNQANWSTFISKPRLDGRTHHIYGWKWHEESNIWNIAKWDGTVYDPTKMSRSDFTNAICPDVDMIRGLRELYLQHNPFIDVNNPTKAEVDEWHRLSINHVRALVGYTSDDYKIKKDSCLFIRALWADQRKHTNIWNEDYPNNTCGSGSSIHCGNGFIPNAEDQIPYLYAGRSACSGGANPEGVFVRSRAHIPWTFKWIRPFCESLEREGFWGGHVGPFFHREKFGFSFWDVNPTNPRSYTTLRAQWGGRLNPSKYQKP